MDVARLKALIDLVAGHSIANLEIVEGDTRVRIKAARNPAKSRGTAVSASAEDASRNAEDASKIEPDKSCLVSAPMSGTFFAAPSPSEPAFCQIGDPIEPDTTLCIIEAMKTLTLVPSSLSGRLRTILVANGSFVEIGQPLFEIAQD